MRANYHTHTTWCDGRNTTREMAEAAVAKGFDVLGFDFVIVFIHFRQSLKRLSDGIKAFCHTIVTFDYADVSRVEVEDADFITVLVVDWYALKTIINCNVHIQVLNVSHN